MDEIGRAYLRLALHLDRHFEGFVDAYFGPPALKAEVQAGEPRSLALLADDVRRLREAVEASDYDPQRKGFLERQIRAMGAVVRNLSGDRLEFAEEVEAYFDITPRMVDTAVFEAAHAEMDALLPGQGALSGRWIAWKKALEIPSERVLPVCERARDETRRRTAALFALPPGEDLSLELVSSQPWSAYNWYLGEYRSRIDVNTDLPLRLSSVVTLIAHEAYPGHHTEHAVKEHCLYRQQGRAEHAVLLLLAPECVLAEGIADSGADRIFSEEELAGFVQRELCPLAGLEGLDAALQVRLARAADGLSGLGGNAALLLHRGGWTAKKVQDYVEHYGLRTPAEAAQTLKFVQNPLFRSYIFNYATGKALLAPLLAGADANAVYWRLLSEPFAPRQVRDWAAERKPAP